MLRIHNTATKMNPCDVVLDLRQTAMIKASGLQHLPQHRHHHWMSLPAPAARNDGRPSISRTPRVSDCESGSPSISKEGVHSKCPAPSIELRTAIRGPATRSSSKCGPTPHRQM